MKVGDYKQAKARQIIEDAISQLCALGMDPDDAARLLVIQGTIRVENAKKRAGLVNDVRRQIVGED